MKVKYIGNHVKTDSITGVGLSWEPGQVRDVTSTVAEHLLAYKDTWVKAEDEIHHHENEALGPVHAEAGRKEDPVDFLEKDDKPEEPLAVVNFHAMDKPALEKYAKEQWNETFHKNISESVLRERVTKLHTKHQMEDKLR
jgi:hypothetical protein